MTLRTKLLSLALAAIMLLSLGLVACGGGAETTAPETTSKPSGSQTKTLRVATLAGPTGMGMSKMMLEGSSNKDYTYTFEVCPDPSLLVTQMVGTLAGNEASFDIAALPTNSAANVFNKTNGAFKVLALNTLGVLYILDNGNSVTTIESLKGKTIGVSVPGSTPEYILRYVLSQNGIDPEKDVTLQFYADHDTLAAQVIAGNIDIAMLPEPKVSAVKAQNKNTRVAISLTEEWNKISDRKLVQGCVVVNSAFADANPDLIATFLADYAKSAEYIADPANLEDAAAKVVEAGIIPKVPIAKLALPNANIVLITGEEMKTTLDAFLRVLNGYAPASIGGSVPSDSFYYIPSAK